MIGGIHLEGKKELSLIQWTLPRHAAPARVRIPLAENEKIRSRPVVKAGDRVVTGQLIAVPENENSVSLHASVTGRVVSIGEHPHPVLGEGAAIEIESEESDAFAEGIGQERTGTDDLTAGDLLTLFRDYGIVDLKDPSQAVHTKILSRSPHDAPKTLVLNGCEPEPYLNADYCIMMSHPVEVIKGAELLRRAAGCEKVIIAMSEDQLEAAELLKSKIFFMKWDHVEIYVLSSLYPQGHETVLFHDIFGGKLESVLQEEDPREGILFNVATAFAVYEAVVWQKPLYERAVTLGGECVVDPRSVWLRIGTLYPDAFRTCRGLLREPRKLLMGGPMKGRAQYDMDRSVTKATQALLAIPKEVARQEEVLPCIRCGECVDVCPVQISPVMITLSAEAGLYERARDYGVDFCLECGNCSYVCPSKRPMIELIHTALQH